MMQNKVLSFLGLIKRTGNIVEGYNNCEEAIKIPRKICLMIFSEDVSEKSKKNFEYYCDKNNISVIQCFSKEELGHSVGRTELNIIGITSKKMAAKLLSNYQEYITNNKVGGERIV